VQGSLAEFRLAEILQLVAVQQKTGLLRLSRGTNVVTFYFDAGLLVSTRDRRYSGQDPFLDYLKRVGCLHPETAAQLASRVESSREDIVDVLLNERFLTDEEVRGALDDLAQELVHKTFGWRDGTYHFIGGDEALTGLRHRLQIKIDGILMEGARRADEWPRLLEKLPGPETVVDLVSNPGTGFGERARHVFEQIQGPTRLGEILRRSRVSEYETYETVMHGVEAGFVRVLERPRVAPPEVVEAQPGPRPPRASRRERLWTLPRPVAWLVALGVSLVVFFASSSVLPLLVSETSRRAAAELEMENARTAVRDGIEVYRALHGRYPPSLTALAPDNLASAELLRRAGPLRYEIAADGSGFALSPAAPGASTLPR
jgi:hypothetical protein